MKDLFGRLNDDDRLLALIEAVSDVDDTLFGRKKLIKLVFLGEFLDLDQDRLTTDRKFTGFDFIIYDYGPFSYDVMNAYDDLKDGGFINEQRRNNGFTIGLTEEGKERAEKAEKEMDEEKLNRLETLAKDFGKETGATLEEKSLKYLNITKDDKKQLMGTPVEVVINEEN